MGAGPLSAGSQTAKAVRPDAVKQEVTRRQGGPVHATWMVNEGE